ncbi:NAD kinase [Ekhidna sp. To15]|uniref:NAD kinase n=1 Tax=Ekhidna sp. To15 TaxID=3395267 RepID=UPI003F51F2DA
MSLIKKVALHGLSVEKDSEKYLTQIIDRLNKEGVEIWYTSPFYSRNTKLLGKKKNIADEISSDFDSVFSLGGDGTFLESLLWVGENEVPILGINMGRLGFLASIAKEFIKESLYLLFKGEYEVESRSLLQLETNMDLFNGKTYALNECAILRKDSSAMIMVKCYINGQYLNTYWADGLMVATPTGSTGYSLSCGGPLMMPDSKDFIITPVSPHNLNVRPLIVSDESELSFEIETRNRSFLISLDSRSETIENDVNITVKKAPFYAKLIRIEGINFPDTIRNKLGWGFDKRN